jgi:hypothetical protein
MPPDTSIYIILIPVFWSAGSRDTVVGIATGYSPDELVELKF